jgi:hypothetical protein
MPPEPDFFLLDSRKQITHAVEVKYYPPDRINPRLIAEGIRRLLLHTEMNQFRKAIFIVSVEMPDELRAHLEEEYGCAIVDQRDLVAMAGKSAELLDDLRTLLDINIAGETKRAETVVHHILTNKLLLAPLEQIEREPESEDLCAELKRLPSGNSTWNQFERLATNILKNLFKDDLVGWYEQERTDDGLNRFDLVCRINNEAGGVWRFIAGELGSRYVLFEFENYSDKLEPGTIYTTERYLLEHGKRTVGFLISRAGVTKNTRTAIQGAMRENGKLIIPLDDEDLCHLLHKRASAGDVTPYIYELVDEFLIKLPR